MTAVVKVKTRHYHYYRSCDTSNNVCWDLQNWHYCFYQWHHYAFDVTLTNIFHHQSMSLLILKISLSKIKRKMYDLPIIKFLCINFYDILTQW